MMEFQLCGGYRSGTYRDENGSLSSAEYAACDFEKVVFQGPPLLAVASTICSRMGGFPERD